MVNKKTKLTAANATLKLICKICQADKSKYIIKSVACKKNIKPIESVFDSCLQRGLIIEESSKSGALIIAAPMFKYGHVVLSLAKELAGVHFKGAPIMVVKYFPIDKYKKVENILSRDSFKVLNSLGECAEFILNNKVVAMHLNINKTYSINSQRAKLLKISPKALAYVLAYLINAKGMLAESTMGIYSSVEAERTCNEIKQFNTNSINTITSEEQNEEAACRE